jgi:hypothetical protein
LTELINETTAPWILGGLGVLVLITIVQISSAWRRVKRSPYFFLRQQAERRLQNRLWTLVIIFAAGGATLYYANQAPPDNTVRMALLANAKPVEAFAETAVDVDELPVIALDAPGAFEVNGGENVLNAGTTITAAVDLSLDGADRLALPPGEPVLPEEFDQVEPEVELGADSQFTRLVFSTEINDDYDPVSPRRTFVEGFYTIYATFDYQGMADGMAWSWVWRRDGEIVNGGNELWQYADEGPGWIYYEPPEGFSPGQYTLEVWVNGELFQQASLVIESEAANR